MDIFDTVAKVQVYSRKAHQDGKRVGVVPTMGYLHEGHLSLVDIAKQHADIVIVTIFVNPTQFGPDEDFHRYPRDFDKDKERCEERGVSAIFAPSVEEMYPEPISTWVEEEHLSQGLCGKSRPDHFKGVTTVVTKLFNATLPDVAVFGQKDAQQVRVIRKMVRDLNFPVEIITAPIIREPDCLAMSSRNVYLSDDERKRAISISQSLKNAEIAIKNDGVKDVTVIHQMIEDKITQAGGKVDYIEIVDEKNLERVNVIDRKVLIAVAAFFGKTRLIDNIVV